MAFTSQNAGAFADAPAATGFADTIDTPFMATVAIALQASSAETVPEATSDPMATHAATRRRGDWRMRVMFMVGQCATEGIERSATKTTED